MGLAEGERLAGPSEGLLSCWNHCPGAVASSDTSWVRRDRWRLQSVSGRRCTVTAAAAPVSGHIDAGPVAWQGEVGSGRTDKVCPVCNGIPGHSWSSGQSPSVHGRGRAGWGRAAACSRARPSGSSRNLERYSWNKGKHYTGGDGSKAEIGDRGDWNLREGEARREDARGDLGGSPWRGNLPSRAPVPRPEGLPA